MRTRSRCGASSLAAAPDNIVSRSRPPFPPRTTISRAEKSTSFTRSVTASINRRPLPYMSCAARRGMPSNASSTRRKVLEKRAHLALAHVARMTPAVKPHVHPHPIRVRLGGARTPAAELHLALDRARQRQSFLHTRTITMPSPHGIIQSPHDGPPHATKSARVLATAPAWANIRPPAPPHPIPRHTAAAGQLVRRRPAPRSRLTT